MEMEYLLYTAMHESPYFHEFINIFKIKSFPDQKVWHLKNILRKHSNLSCLSNSKR